MPDRRLFKLFAAGLAALPVALFAALFAPAAQAQQRLNLPAGEVFTHPHSQVVVPAELAGLPRGEATLYAEDFLDVGINFDNPITRERLSVYIFRHTNGDVPVWFAQAQASLESQLASQSPELAFEASAFVPPGQPNASGLRAFYTLGEGSARNSTGVALFDTGEWFVKLRASSGRRSAAQLALWMDEALRALEVPVGDGGEVAPVIDCPDRLRFRGRARDVRGDAAGGPLAGLLGNLIMQAAREAHDEEEGADAEPAAPVTWCRDHEIGPVQVVYRANAATDSYLLALGDNGSAVHVAPDVMGQLLADEGDDPSGHYSVSLIMPARNLNFPTQDRMPAPNRVIQLLEANRVTGSVVTWGDERRIEINSDAL
ncbi:MAG: hypothetical protein KDE15_05445 [Erythrobacter sp.]|nr:hypothetical protein [Erythrobacter sp.]